MSRNDGKTRAKYIARHYVDDWGGEYHQTADEQLPQLRQPQPLFQSLAAASTPVSVDQGGTATMSLDRLMELIHESATGLDVPPRNFTIASAEYEGHAARDCIELRCRFRVSLMENKWTMVRLLPSSLAIVSMRVNFAVASSVEQLLETEPETSHPLICIRNNAFALVTDRAGDYQLELVVRSRYESARVRGVKLNIPLAVRNSLSFNVDDSEAVVAIHPSLCTKTVRSSDGDSSGVPLGTSVSCVFPPTTTLKIHISPRASDDTHVDAPRNQEEELVSVEQLTVISVGEGLMRASVRLNFTLAHGSRSLFEIAIPEGARVLTVEGIAMRRFEVVGSYTGGLASAPPMDLSSSQLNLDKTLPRPLLGRLVRAVVKMQQQQQQQQQ